MPLLCKSEHSGLLGDGLELVHVLQHVGQVLQVRRTAREIEHTFGLLAHGGGSALGIRRGKVVVEGLNPVEMALLQRVLLDLQIFTTLLLLDGEFLYCREVAVLLVLLVHLALGRTSALVLLAVTKHLLLEGGEVELLYAWAYLLLLLLLCLPTGRLQINEIEVSGVLARHGCFGYPGWRFLFLAGRRSSHILLLPLLLPDKLRNNLSNFLLAKCGD